MPAAGKRRALGQHFLRDAAVARAIADLERYLKRVPDAADREDVVQQLTALHQLRSIVN